MCFLKRNISLRNYLHYKFEEGGKKVKHFLYHTIQNGLLYNLFWSFFVGKVIHLKHNEN